jgi:polysaccharide biosynthesis protein PslG
MNVRFYIRAALLICFAFQCSGCYRAQNCTFLPRTGNTSTGHQWSNSSALGVNINFTDPQPDEVKMISDAGFRWIRMDLKWDLTETEKGKYDFSAYDRLMASLEPFGIRALFILDYSNPLYDGDAPPRSEAARKAFAHWAVAAGKHFANRGALWEIYNEPNHPQFWPPKPKVADYVALALEVGKAFREELPNEPLIGPATSEIDFEFLEACFKGGLLEYWSFVSVHPYRQTPPESAAEDYCRLRQLIAQYAPQSARPDGPKKQIDIISSEWGYSSAWRNMNAEVQAEMLTRSMLTNLGNGIALSIWYDWQDDGLDPKEPEHHFGTVLNSYYKDRNPVYEPKPAYLAVQTLTKVLAGLEFQRRIDAGDAGDYVLQFGNGPKLTIAAWTTSSKEHEVIIPLDRGEYRVIRHTGAATDSTVNDDHGLVLKITSAPIYVQRTKPI